VPPPRIRAEHGNGIDNILTFMSGVSPKQGGIRIDAVPLDDADAMRLRAAARVETNAAVGYHSDHAPTLTQSMVRVHFLVRNAAGVAVACGSLVDAPDGVLEIRGLYIRRDARADHYAGDTLLDALEAHASAAGAPAIVWEIAPQMRLPITMMTRRGYVHIANWGPYVGVADSVCFAKPLV
jgi:hypothetical protein